MPPILDLTNRFPSTSVRKEDERNMRRIALLAAACIATAWPPALTRAEHPSPTASLARLLDKLPHASAKCSALIVDLDSGKTVYSRNAADLLIPASNQKLLVQAAAVDAATDDWAFVTRIGIRDSDLFIVGDGDPGFGDPNIAQAKGENPATVLDRWANALRSAGHSRIAGDLVVDVSIFDDQFVHPDWEKSDLVKWYGAPVGGLNFNDNCVEITAWPGASGAAAVWSVFPPCSLIKLTNKCVSKPGAKNATPVVGRHPGTWDFVLSGQVAKRGTLQSISIPEPNHFAATVIREHLAAKGITVNGRLRFDRLRRHGHELPSDCRVIAEHRTPLADVLARIGHDSQNLFAEAMMKRLGYAWSIQNGASQPIGSWPTGRQAILATLERAGCDIKRMTVADGSGLSRTNRASAQDFVNLLQFMHRHPRRQQFINSMGGNRTGGALVKRFRDIDGDVYAKTGYMSGVRSLSGYVRTNDDHWYAFSIIFNSFPGQSTPYFQIQEKVCKVLAGTARNRPS